MTLGHSYSDIEQMEMWEGADYLGVGDDQEPTIIGTRTIHLKSDGDETTGPNGVSQAAIDRASLPPDQLGASTISDDW